MLITVTATHRKMKYIRSYQTNYITQNVVHQDTNSQLIIQQVSITSLADVSMTPDQC